jgi:hypothetical protein
LLGTSVPHYTFFFHGKPPFTDIFIILKIKL